MYESLFIHSFIFVNIEKLFKLHTRKGNHSKYWKQGKNTDMVLKNVVHGAQKFRMYMLLFQFSYYPQHED